MCVCALSSVSVQEVGAGPVRIAAAVLAPHRLGSDAYAHIADGGGSAADFAVVGDVNSSVEGSS